VVCGITSGLACVHYGIAESTKDCDLLCHTASFATLLDLRAQHLVRVEAAAATLDDHPLRSYGLARYVEEARQSTIRLVHPDLVRWLPDVSGHF
jgi:hypothetical protein